MVREISLYLVEEDSGFLLVRWQLSVQLRHHVQWSAVYETNTVYLVCVAELRHIIL